MSGMYIVSVEFSDSSKAASSYLNSLSLCLHEFFSNAIGPLIAIWLIFNDGSVAQKSESPILLLLYGGVGMSIGMWCFGRRVNTTIGKSLTKIVPMR